MLEINRLFHKYDKQRNYTLRNISFQLNAGEIISILGENGCGKTTLLNTIAGLQPTTKGSIFLFNEKVKGPNGVLIPGHKNIALLSQDYKLMPQHTVFENLEYFIRQANERFIKLQSSNLLRHFDLLRHRNKKPNQLSGGQQQKLAMAIALSTQPKVLLMDEPFSNLDIVQSTVLKEEVYKAVEAFNLGVIIVTHNIKDALSMSNKVIVMQKGQIIQADTPQNIYTKPINTDVAKLTGEINIVDIKLLKTLLNDNKIDNSKTKGKKLFGIRPENIVLKKGNDGTIESVKFHGENQLIKIRLKSKLLTVSVSSKKNIEVEDKYSLQISTKDFQPLN